MSYGFLHNGRVFTADATAAVTTQRDVDLSNREIEARELAWLKTAPDKVFLYVKEPPDANDPRAWYVATWPGTIVSDGRAFVGPSVPVGGISGCDATRRSVECRIFGVRYVGWYYESAGDYCRLRKAKRQ